MSSCGCFQWIEPGHSSEFRNHHSHWPPESGPLGGTFHQFTAFGLRKRASDDIGPESHVQGPAELQGSAKAGGWSSQLGSGPPTQAALCPLCHCAQGYKGLSSHSHSMACPLPGIPQAWLHPRLAEERPHTGCLGSIRAATKAQG